MPDRKNRWIAIALTNLAIVACLGVLLRSKILFSMPGIDFKFILNAHSHFAFGGWITLCLFTLMTYEILPRQFSARPIYKYLLNALLVTACGMLFSFPFQGYGLVAIIFSTLFIFVSYAFSWVFIKDLLKSEADKSVLLLCVVSLIALCVSSAGPFTLAYIMATHSANVLLYRDAIYSYLHLQYNGFFTLSAFALFINQFITGAGTAAQIKAKRFANMLSLSVVPTLFLSYLWHYPDIVVRGIAVSGCVLLVIVLILFIAMMKDMATVIKSEISPFAKVAGALSLFAFVLKTILQIGPVFPSLGNAVFANRAVIIGYLHLVMLGFVTLYILSHLIHIRFFDLNNRLAKTGIIIFVIAVITNEIVLMSQGLAEMLMKSSPVYPWLLWAAAIGLFIGAVSMSVAAIITQKARRVHLQALST